MNSPREDHSSARPETSGEERNLHSIERPADDPQTRPALDPEVGLAERRVPEDS